MAYRVLNDVAKRRIDDQIVLAKNAVQQQRDLAAAQTTISAIVRVAIQLDKYAAEIDGVLAGVDTAAFQAYVRDLFGDQTYDPVAEGQAARTAMRDLRDWVDTNAPRAPGNQALEAQTWSIATGFQPIVLTTAQKNAFDTQADAFLATVE